MESFAGDNSEKSDIETNGTPESAVAGRQENQTTFSNPALAGLSHGVAGGLAGGPAGGLAGAGDTGTRRRRLSSNSDFDVSLPPVGFVI